MSIDDNLFELAREYNFFDIQIVILFRSMAIHADSQANCDDHDITPWKTHFNSLGKHISIHSLV